jgi:peptidoglycan/LPS O-acetylase OafA/YrhL
MHNIRRLDSFRGLAAIAVLLDHLCTTFLMPYLGSTGALDIAMSLLGGWAVIVFFILSGYLITYSILYNTSTNGSFRWIDYLISRIARIYPPLICSLVLCTIIFFVAKHFTMHGTQGFRLPGDLYVIREKFEFKFREVFDSLLMRGGMLDLNGPLWSLYIEVKIYILAMFVAILMAGGVGKAGKVVSIIGIVFLLSDLAPFFAYVAIWMLGGGFAMILQGHIMKRTFLRPLYAGAVAITLCCAIINPNLIMPANISTGAGFAESISLSVILAGFMFDSQLGAGVISKFSGTAKYSYTLYIVHFPLLLFAFSLTHEFLSSNLRYGYLAGVCALTFIAIIGIAQSLALYFENKRYFETLIRKLAYRFSEVVENYRR